MKNKIKEIIMKLNSISLENGDSTDLYETSKAVNKYINSNEPSCNEPCKVVKKRKIKTWPIVLAAIFAMSLGFKIKENRVSNSEILDCLEMKCVAYGINPDIVLEQILDVENIKNINVGPIEQNQNDTSIYSIDYVSIIDENQVAHKETTQGKNIKEIIDEYCKTHYKNIEDLIIKIHINGSISGWVSLNDILNEENDKTEIMLDEYYVGELISFENDEQYFLDLLTDNLNLSHKYLDDNTNRIIQLEIDEDLKIPVVDENGNLMPEGSIVVGSDGQEYKITKLSLNSQKKLVFDKDKIEYILTWNIQNINKQLALLAIATSLVGTYFINKKDEKTKVKSR